MTKETTTDCTPIPIWGSECKRRVNRQNCPAMTNGENCQGVEDDAGKNNQFAIAVQRLEDYRSTGEGLGHLSNKRAVHSSPVPFR